MNIEICQCKGCEIPAISMGMCNKHWRRNRRYGSPFATKNHVMRGLPVERRFELQHKKTADCWEWIASTDKNGYGIFHGVINGREYHRAHRFSWAFHSNSDIPKDMVVCHSCDNPRCVNPGHLWLVTLADNHADMVRKGRRRTEPRGEMAHMAKLTEE